MSSVSIVRIFGTVDVTQVYPFREKQLNVPTLKLCYTSQLMLISHEISQILGNKMVV